MFGLRSTRDAWGAALGTILAWLLTGFFHIFLWAAFIVILPFSVIWLTLQRMAPGVFGDPYGGIAPEDVAAFDAVWEDRSAGDIDALEDHARTNKTFPHGRDPFIDRHWLTNAVHFNAPASVRWLLEQGVDPNFHDDEGHTPLMSAFEMCDHPPGTDNSVTAFEIARRLLDHGADPNFRVTLDRTALHTAACLANPEVIRLLLERGADPFAYDSDYVPVRPIDDARTANRWDNAAVLENWMNAHPAPEA